MPQQITPQEAIDFIGIAAGRSGSSWLSECLRAHPDIDFPKRKSRPGQVLNWFFLRGEKELEFFNIGNHCDRLALTYSNAAKGLPWYLDQFPTARPGRVRGEFTPGYYYYAGAAEAILRTFPDVKLIAVLRNPVDMIYSLHWFVARFAKREPESFEQAVGRGRYLPAGLYYRSLKPFFDRFPRERIHVVIYDDIRQDSGKVLRAVYEFLGVRADFVPAALHQRVNEVSQAKSRELEASIKAFFAALRRLGLGWVADFANRSATLQQLYFRLNTVSAVRPPMTAELRSRLKLYFRDDIVQLEGLIGRDLSAWR